MLYAFPIKTNSNAPVKNGIVRAKNRIGTSWAGRVLNSQSMSPPGARSFKPGHVLVDSHIVETSTKTGNNICLHKIKVEDYELAVFLDSSAVLIKKSGSFHFQIAPFALYLPKKVKLRENTLEMSLIDWLEPCEAPHIDLKTGREIQEQIIEDIKFWIEAFKSTPHLDDHRNGIKGDGAFPWFFPTQTVNSEDAQKFNKFLKGLSLTFGHLEHISVAGRSLCASGKWTSVKAEKHQVGGFWNVKRLKALEKVFDHENFPVPAERQIYQAYSGSDKVSSQNGNMQGLIMGSSKLHRDPKSAHESLEIQHHTLSILKNVNSNLLKDIKNGKA